MNPEENEKLGLGLNLIEGLNNFMMFSFGKISVIRKWWIYEKISKVIELMDGVLA